MALEHMEFLFQLAIEMKDKKEFIRLMKGTSVKHKQTT